MTKKIYTFLLISAALLPIKAQTGTTQQPKDTINVTPGPEATSAISTVRPERFGSSATNPANALYGMLPGLYVKQGTTVAWSNDPIFYVRGAGSLNNNAPLVLVDGVERPMSSLTQEEIESISVLKDAAALALYGMRGANGVVYVKTKRGSVEGMNVKLSYQFGYNKPSRLPQLADGYTYAQAMNEALTMDGLAPVYNSYDLEAFRTGSNPELFPSVDWVGEGIRNKGFSHQFTASFRGGTNVVRYYTMINYIGDNGFLKPVDLNSDYNTQMEWDRLSVRANLDINLTRSTQLTLNLLGQIAQHNRPTANYPSLFSTLYTVPSAAFPVKTSTGNWGGDHIHSNPIAEIAGRGYSTGSDRALFADMRLTQDLSAWINGLSAEVAVAYDNRASYWDGKSKTYLSENLLPERDAQGNVTGVTRTEYGQESALSYSHSLGYQNMVTQVEGKVNYQTVWDEKHLLNTFITYHQEENSLMGQNNTYRRQSIIGNVHYGYKDKYLLNLAMSYAGSSVMSKGDKYRFYPALSGAWVVSSEDFMSSVNAIDYLKLRASAGLTGSDLFEYDLGKYYYYLNTNSYYFGGNNNSAGGNGEGRLPNNDLNAEKSFKANVGFDLQMFGKLKLTADLFFEKRTNILVAASPVYSSVIGATMPMLNEGKVRNYGIETALEWNQQVGDFGYMLAGNFSFTRNKILNMNEGYQPEEYLKRTGQRVGQYFGLEAIGFFKDDAEIASAPTQSFSQVRPGDIRYKDQNGDGVIDDYDQVAMGYSTLLPEISYGFTVGFSYREFGLKADFQGIANYSIMKNMAAFYWPLRNNTTVSNHYLENRWTPDNPNAKYPRLTTLDNSNNFRNNSVWLENGSFLKLRNLELSYRLPEKLVNRTRLSDVSFFVRGMNLFSLDHVKDLDPELMYASYPSFSSYHIGFNVEF